MRALFFALKIVLSLGFLRQIFKCFKTCCTESLKSAILSCTPLRRRKNSSAFQDLKLDFGAISREILKMTVHSKLSSFQIIHKIKNIYYL